MRAGGIDFWWGGREFGGGGVYSIGGIFLDGVKLANFQLVGGGGGGTSAIPPSMENPGPWKIQGLYPRLVEILHDFFLITLVNSFSWPLKFPQFVFSIPLEIPCPQPPCMFFF